MKDNMNTTVNYI